MGAGGDFGNDATVSGEKVDLRDDDIAQNSLTVFDDGGGGLIARSFDAEDFHRGIITGLEQKSPQWA